MLTIPKKGVSDVHTDVVNQTVIVQAEDSVTPELMLEKLTKVRTNSKREKNNMFAQRN